MKNIGVNKIDITKSEIKNDMPPTPKSIAYEMFTGQNINIVTMLSGIFKRKKIQTKVVETTYINEITYDRFNLLKKIFLFIITCFVGLLN